MNHIHKKTHCPVASWYQLPPELIVMIGHRMSITDQFSLCSVNQVCRALSCVIMLPAQLHGTDKSRYIAHSLLWGDTAGLVDVFAAALEDSICLHLLHDMPVWLARCYRSKESIAQLCRALAPPHFYGRHLAGFGEQLGHWLYQQGIPGDFVSDIFKGIPGDFVSDIFKRNPDDFDPQLPLWAGMIRAYVKDCVDHREHGNLRLVLEDANWISMFMLLGMQDLAYVYNDIETQRILVTCLLQAASYRAYPGGFSSLLWDIAFKYLRNSRWDFLGTLRYVLPPEGRTTDYDLAQCILDILKRSPHIIRILVHHTDATVVVLSGIVGMTRSFPSVMPGESTPKYQEWFDVIGNILNEAWVINDNYNTFCEIGAHQSVANWMKEPKAVSFCDSSKLGIMIKAWETRQPDPRN